LAVDFDIGKIKEVLVQFKGPAHLRAVPLVEDFPVDQTEVKPWHDIWLKGCEILAGLAFRIFPDPGPKALILRQQQVHRLVGKRIVNDLVEFQSHRQVANAGIRIDLLEIPDPPLGISQWVLLIIGQAIDVVVLNQTFLFSFHHSVSSRFSSPGCPADSLAGTSLQSARATDGQWLGSMSSLSS